jgi:hypothetical protein
VGVGEGGGGSEGRVVGVGDAFGFATGVGVSARVMTAIGARVSVGATAPALGAGAGPQEARGAVLKHSNTTRIDSRLVLMPSSVLRWVGQIISLGIIQDTAFPRTPALYPRTHGCARKEREP